MSHIFVHLWYDLENCVTLQTLLDQLFAIVYCWRALQAFSVILDLSTPWLRLLLLNLLNRYLLFIGLKLQSWRFWIRFGWTDRIIINNLLRHMIFRGRFLISSLFLFLMRDWFRAELRLLNRVCLGRRLFLVILQRLLLPSNLTYLNIKNSILLL